MKKALKPSKAVDFNKEGVLRELGVEFAELEKGLDVAVGVSESNTSVELTDGIGDVEEEGSKP